MSKDQTVEWVDMFLEKLGLAAVAHHGITEVSGGQLQRASICRALSTDPAVVFADEPTGALSTRMSAEVMDALDGIHRDGATIVMVRLPLNSISGLWRAGIWQRYVAMPSVPVMSHRVRSARETGRGGSLAVEGGLASGFT